jgi:hypothetical protein
MRVFPNLGCSEEDPQNHLKLSDTRLKNHSSTVPIKASRMPSEIS